MKECVFKGVATALITPFTKENKIDFNALSKLIDFQLTSGTDALVILGTTAEASTLTDDEKQEICHFTINKVQGKVPVIAGAGSNSTRKSIELGIMLKNSGVDALLYVTPYYNKTNDEGLVRHFGTIAEDVNLPIILYNVPSRTGMNLSPEVCAELDLKYNNIVGIKEAGNDIRSVSKLHTLCGNDFSVYTGNDDLILPSLSCGAMGVISVLSNLLPSSVVSMCRSYFSGDEEATRVIAEKYQNLISLLFCETNPIPIKYALSLIGMCEETTRLPLWNMSDTNKNKLKKELEKLHII